jgi:dienelactone hydrolase
LPALVAWLLLPWMASAGESWTSPATGGALSLHLFEPEASLPGATSAATPLVFYLKNLAAPRIGTEPDEAILRDLRATGHLVAVVDYAGHPRSVVPSIYPDLVRLREDVQAKRLFADRKLDAARIYIVPAGCRLRRDVVFYRDAARTLALDVIYPSQPKAPVGAVLEFSCDNAERMGNFSLAYCTDALLPAAAIDGHAAAMADHPVAAPYKGLDAMPESAFKAKAAVRALRALGPELGLNGRVVSAGFSRGSGMALLLATTSDLAELESGGEHVGVSSSVQGAVVMSGRFTYLDLLPDDKMIPRYVKVWGERAANEDVWRRHGALDYLRGPTVPFFLTINATESPEAFHQMDVLRRRLAGLGSPFVYHPEAAARGHKMPLDPAVLEPLHAYLRDRLSPP